MDLAFKEDYEPFIISMVSFYHLLDNYSNIFKSINFYVRTVLNKENFSSFGTSCATKLKISIFSWKLIIIICKYCFHVLFPIIISTKVEANC